MSGQPFFMIIMKKYVRVRAGLGLVRAELHRVDAEMQQVRAEPHRVANNAISSKERADLLKRIVTDFKVTYNWCIETYR